MQKVLIPALALMLGLSLALSGCAQAADPAAASTTTIDESRLPVATAYIAANGNVLSSSGNVTITHTLLSGLYQVTVTGNSFDSTYVIVLTPATNSKTYMDSYVFTGNLYCASYDEAGAVKDTDFSIAIWKNKY